jgi:hypothetical protein
MNAYASMCWFVIVYVCLHPCTNHLSRMRLCACDHALTVYTGVQTCEEKLRVLHQQKKQGDSQVATAKKAREKV